MHIYTHLFVASELEPLLRPADPPAYYLGAIIPDVRYLVGATRDQTHLTSVQLLALMQHYPNLQSFLLGYLVHCEIDLIDLTRVLFERTPYRLLRPLRQLQLAGFLIELHSMEQARIHPPIAVESNAMLADLGIEAEAVRRFAEDARRFLQAPSFAAEMEALHQAGVLAQHGARRYLRLAGALERHAWLRRALFGVVPAGETAARLPEIIRRAPAVRFFTR